MFGQVKSTKIDRKILGSGGNLCFSEKEKDRTWKDYMQRNISEEYHWDHNVENARWSKKLCKWRLTSTGTKKQQLGKPRTFRCIIRVDCC